MAVLRNEAEYQVIVSSALFRGLSSEQIAAVLDPATLSRIKKGVALFHQDDAVKSTYLVVSGRIKLHQVTTDGAQTLLRVIGPGQILAIVSAVSSANYPATATAERDSSVLSWDGKVFDRLFLRIPLLCRNALGILSSRVQEMQLRFGELAAERTERRLARALLRLASQVGRKQANGVVLDLSLSRQDLAEMIGTTLFSVSRILGDWQRSRLVEIGRQKVILTDPHALVRIADEEA